MLQLPAYHKEENIDIQQLKYNVKMFLFITGGVYICVSRVIKTI